MILVFGSINVDLIARVPAIPRPGETVLSAGYTTAFGGKGANQAVAAARARTSPAVPVLMAGAVGDDAFGRDAVANLAAHGVDTAAVQTVSEPTGCAFITVDHAGENAITVASGANRAVSAAHLADTALRSGGTLVLQMEVPAGESVAMARRARAAGMRVLLNLAPAPAGLTPEALRGLLEPVDVLIVNKHELHAASSVLCPQVSGDDETRAVALAAAAGLVCVVTRGAAGAMAAEPSGALTQAPALPVEPVDTTGAGDAFVGVLAASLTEGQPLPAAMRRACVGASLACRALGAQAALPDADAIDAALSGTG
ncbi:MAG TPA: ribokinase [Azospirillum sp.]|nr:ribokinase [Azospirillum sp.]